jgi:hypothetical protein
VLWSAGYEEHGLDNAGGLQGEKRRTLCLAIIIAMGFPLQGVLQYHIRPALRSLVC